MDQWEAFWGRVEAKVRLVAQGVVRGHGVPTNTDYEDLAQTTLQDLLAFVKRKRTEQPDITVSDMETEVIRFGVVALKNNMVDLIRTHERREELLAQVGGSARAYSIQPSRPCDPAFKAEIQDWVRRIKQTTNSQRMKAIADAIATAVAGDLDVTRKDIARMAGASADDMSKFDRLTIRFGNMIERNSK